MCRLTFCICPDRLQDLLKEILILCILFKLCSLAAFNFLTIMILVVAIVFLLTIHKYTPSILSLYSPLD
jgi:hypothetical protein